MKIGLSKRGKLAGGLGLLLALLLVIALGVPAGAQPWPSVYHQFIGSVRICDELVLTGDVTATIAGSTVDWTTPINASGNYGYAPDYFLIPINDLETPEKDGGEDGDTVQFWVQGRLAGEFIFEANEGTLLNLQVTDVYLETNANPPAGGTVTGAGTYTCSDDAPVQAFPAGGWVFTGWSDDLTGDINPTTVPMDGDKTVTANFTEVGVTYYTLDMEVVGNGTVTPGDGSYPEGDMTITATEDLGWEFDGWSTDDMGEIANSSAESTTLTLDKDKTVTATFTFEKLPGFLSLVEGVNIIAYTGATANLPEALTNIGPDGEDVVDIIWARGAWTGGEWLYYDPGIPFGTLSQLETDRAYIIVVTEDCTWELP